MVFEISLANGRPPPSPEGFQFQRLERKLCITRIYEIALEAPWLFQKTFPS